MIALVVVRWLLAGVLGAASIHIAALNWSVPIGWVTRRRATLRPDVLRLHSFPTEPMFANQKFWSPAAVGNNAIADGFKMKWHNVGSGRVQLRLPVGIVASASCARPT